MRLCGRACVFARKDVFAYVWNSRVYLVFKTSVSHTYETDVSLVNSPTHCHYLLSLPSLSLTIAMESWSTPSPSLRKVLWSISCSDSWTCDQSARNRIEQTESRWQGSKYQPSPPPLKRALPLPLLRLLPAPSPSISLQPKVGRRRGIWKGIGADRLWKPWQLEQTLGGSILLIYAVFHSPNCSHFTLISKIAVQILNALWSFCCLYWASAVFKGELLTANLLPRVGCTHVVCHHSVLNSPQPTRHIS